MDPFRTFLLISLLATSYPADAAVNSGYAAKRHVSELRDDAYDFVIAGGGTSGLTVADRLSEAFPNSMSNLARACLGQPKGRRS